MIPDIRIGSLVSVENHFIGIVVEKSMETEVYYLDRKVSILSNLYKIYIPVASLYFFRFEEQFEVIA